MTTGEDLDDLAESYYLDPPADRACVVEGCAREVLARGWCGTHYRRWQRHGDPSPDVPISEWVEPGTACSIEGCDLAVLARGWCKLHWQRWSRAGTPTPDVKDRVPKGSGSVGPEGYRMVVRHGHPMAGSRGRILEHRVVLYERIGPGEHPCHWCARAVRWGAAQGDDDLLVTDHVDFDKLNNDPENLVPSCSPCNVTRHPEVTSVNV